MLSVVTGKSSYMSNTLLDATSSFISWRKIDAKNASNEIYVDLAEEMDAIVNRFFYNVHLLFLIVSHSCLLDCGSSLPYSIAILLNFNNIILLSEISKQLIYHIVHCE